MSDQILDEILAATQIANSAWMRGDWEAGYGALISQAEDVSIYGPFGGNAVVGGKVWAARGGETVKAFKHGTSTLHLINAYASGDLVVLVTLEEQSGEIAGKPTQPWSLRVTQVYRREDGVWKVVHRHADPLVRFRPLAETLALAAG